MRRSRQLLQALAAAVGLTLLLAAAPAQAADEPSAAAVHKDLVLRGDARCTRCHDEGDDYPVLAIGQTPHGVKADARTPSCTNCHGESDAHVSNSGGGNERPRPDVVFRGKGKSEADKVNGQCMNCHQTGLRTHWEGSRHQMEGVACTNCHQVHTPRDAVLSKVTQPEVCFSCHKMQRAETHKISHHPILEGKVACSDCHNPHGSTGPKLLIKDSVNETCYTCHAEKRGPFLWEHQPVADDCTNCHTPHGSNSTPLLKARMPFLCQECHSGDHAKNIYSGANLPFGNATTINGVQGRANFSPPAQLNARACTNCHVLVHGSNHPAGAKFQR